MAEMTGVWGKIARVNLTTKEVTVIEPGVDVYKKFLGGAALGTYYLFKEGIVEPDVDPMGPDNMFQIMIGPLTGASPSARSTTVTKSPYNFIGVSTSGGQAAAELKFAGWDGIQVVGKSETPVYIAVIDDNIEIRDASHVWGMGIDECELILKGEVTSPHETSEGILRDSDLTPEWAAIHPIKKQGFGKKRLASCWMIGPGGENGVWFSSVMTEGARAHGRHGTGCIMGTKNLKAIVVRGTKGHPLADKKTFLERVAEIQETMLGNQVMRTYGTTRLGIVAQNVEDAYPIRNWQWGAWADPHEHGQSGQFNEANAFVKRQSCPNCAVHCLFTVQVTSSNKDIDGILTDMPDWEAMGTIGGQLGMFEMPGKTPDDPYMGTVDDKAEAMAKMQYVTFLFDDNSMDFIEGGNLIGLLMELRQRELITPEDLDGIDPQWGDEKACAQLVDKIIYDREGIGKVLSKGTWETAKYFADLKGDQTILKYAQTCHRYGQPAHGVRSGVDKDAMEYVTVSRPNEHTGGGGAGFLKHDWASAIAGQNSKSAVDSLVYCNFSAGYYAGKTAEMVNAATGWGDFTEEDLGKVGARQYCMARLFDIHTQKLTDPKTQWDELVTDRWFDDPLPTGSHKGMVAYEGDKKKLFDVALPEYWKVRGWTEDKGIPTMDTLKSLGIDDICGPIAEQHL